jgi:hypothetical protein
MHLFGACSRCCTTGTPSTRLLLSKSQLSGYHRPGLSLVCVSADAAPIHHLQYLFLYHHYILIFPLDIHNLVCHGKLPYDLVPGIPPYLVAWLHYPASQRQEICPGNARAAIGPQWSENILRDGIKACTLRCSKRDLIAQSHRNMPLELVATAIDDMTSPSN